MAIIKPFTPEDVVARAIPACLIATLNEQLVLNFDGDYCNMKYTDLMQLFADELHKQNPHVVNHDKLMALIDANKWPFSFSLIFKPYGWLVSYYWKNGEKMVRFEPITEVKDV